MTARTSKRKVATAKVKVVAGSARKSSRPSTSKAVQPAKVPAGEAARRMAEWVQGSFLTAALGSRQNNAFEISCSQIVQRAVGAAAVALTLRSDDTYQHFGTTEDARSLAADHSANDPLARCLSSGAEYQVAIGGKRQLTKLHDAAAASHGWSHYLCIPLYSPVGDISGAASIYFAGSVDLRSKVVAFDKNVRAALALALAAHANAPAVNVETHQFNSLAAAIPGVVYQRIVQPDGDIRYTYLSEGARELFGVDPEAVLKDPEVLFKTYTEDYKNTFRKRLIEASQTLTKWDVEASVIMPDGRRKTTHAVARPERRADNSVLWTGVILDASRAKEAEDGLKEANRLVGLANHAKSAFLAKMSHEMRTPLNGVLGMGDLLLKTELSQRQIRLASTLCDSAKGLLGIINDVLDLSRIEAGHFKLDVQDFNLRHCVEDAVELCATSGYRKGLEVNLIIASDIPVGVKSDPVRIRQVLINLIGNAVKFTETGEVNIRLTTGAGADGRRSVVFEVSDTGIGIDAAAISRLFEPFAQADASISRRFGGTGLGLSITRHLVGLLDGTVSLTSERGQGTTVRFEIPFEVTAAAHPAILPHNVTLSGVRVLVIDDRSTSREMLANNLADTGARIDVVDGEEVAFAALSRAALEGDPYRIAIVDRVKPRTSSLHLCRTIRSNPRLAETAMVVLMSTNWNGNPIDQAGLRDTVFLSKPARRADMMAAVVRAHRPDIANVVGSTSIFSSQQHARTAPPALKLRVLLVEDNATNIEVAREYLAELECRVTVAVNGIEAITTFDRAQFDIILMDTQMPELDGLSATRRIRETERARCLLRTPIIAVTANAYDSDKTQALDAGSDDFLSKPFTDVQLRNILQKWSSKTDECSPAENMHAVVTPKTAVAITALESSPAKAIGGQLTERLDETLHAVLSRSRPTFLSRLLRTYLSSMPETVMTLRAAIQQEDGELLRTLAHSLKSSSANVGAKRLAELCRLLDVKLKLGADAADCSSLTDSIETELGLVEDALEQVVAHLPGALNVAAG